MLEIVGSYMNGRFSVIPGQRRYYRKFRLLSNQADFKQIVSHTDFYSEFLCCLSALICPFTVDVRRSDFAISQLTLVKFLLLLFTEFVQF